MKKIFYITGFLIAGLFLENAYAQKSASAVMDIRVEVVRGIQAASSANDIVIHSNSDLKDKVYGTVEMQISKGADYIASFNSDIQLVNNLGEIIGLKSSVKEQVMDDNQVIIEMSGKLHSDPMKKGVYLGSQVARIDFF